MWRPGLARLLKPGIGLATGLALCARGVCHTVITLGARGALACGPEGSVRVPGIASVAIDTVGAGDGFNAALAVALGDGRALPDALRFANATAALACTRRGAQSSMPTRTEVEALLSNT